MYRHTCVLQNNELLVTFGLNILYLSMYGIHMPTCKLNATSIAAQTSSPSTLEIRKTYVRWKLMLLLAIFGDKVFIQTH